MIQQNDSSPVIYPMLMSVIVAALGFWALQDAAYLAAGGVFEYPLDDTYIHLAMAEQLWAGGYGVNPGEYAAASSSPLFSFLLLPLAGTEYHRYVPLFWNAVGLLSAAALWGRILWQVGYGGSNLGLFLAAAGPLALHMVGLSFTGMEHSLHLAATLAIVSGLIRFVDHNHVGKLLMLGIFFAPLLRPEGLALVVMSVIVVLAGRRPKAGVFLNIVGVAPLIGFSAWLQYLGLEAMPSSVTAKLALPHVTGGLVNYLRLKFDFLLSISNVFVLSAMIVAGALLFFISPVRRPVVFALTGAAVGHVVFGGFGWMDRYEIYIVAGLAAALLAATQGRGWLIKGIALAPIAFSAAFYLPAMVTKYPNAPRVVHLQQAQMARFAKDHLAEPVAVNDLGWVAWQNPDYVLDLWGLASREARIARLTNADAGWADAMAQTRGVNVAMIYDMWLSQAIGPDWQPLGTLTTAEPVDYIGSPQVSFYLTGPGDPSVYAAKLAAWSKDLPQGASFEFAAGVRP